jgi:hypothetical protein
MILLRLGFSIGSSETFPKTVLQLRQNFPSSGFSVPHFGQNIIFSHLIVYGSEITIPMTENCCNTNQTASLLNIYWC